MREPIRIYADTSVFGGVFDDEFSEPSKVLFKQVCSKKFLLISSDLIRRELIAAPAVVQEYFQKMLVYTEISDITEDMHKLQQAYIDAKIVSHKCFNDALHVAIATISQCKGIVSWNFRHIVHFQKIPLYNAVNTLNGYPNIFIHSPSEVINDEDEIF